MAGSALPESIEHALLDCMPVARLAMHGTGAAPEVLPIVFARVGRTLYSPIDGKPKSSARLARLRLIAAAPDVGFVLDHYDRDWSRLWWLRFAAHAKTAQPSHPDWDEAVEALRTKYPQYHDTPLFKDEPLMLAFDYGPVRWWAAGGLPALEQWLRLD